VNTILRRQRAAWRRRAPQTSEDDIVWKQWNALQFDKMKGTAIEEAQRVSERVKLNTEKRKQEMAQRVEQAKQILKIRSLLREEQEEKTRRAEMERAAQEERMRIAEARERAEREARERAEREARERERKERAKLLARERVRAKAERLARERAERDSRAKPGTFRKTSSDWRRLNQERERNWQERSEHTRREREQQRREFNEQARKFREIINDSRFPTGGQTRAQLQPVFDLYTKKWDALKAGIQPDDVAIPPLVFAQLPWPVLLTAPSCVEDITMERVKEFIFHPIYNVEGKTKASLIRQELARWHPDKFNIIVLARVAPEEQNAVVEGADRVARIFNAIKGEL
jgi:hypothetical protein